MSETAEKKSVYRVQGLTCANCATKFEQNVKNLSEVKEAKVNFGASKLSVIGEASVAELEKAGAFEGLRVYPEKEKRGIVREPFWKKKSTVQIFISAALLAAGYIAGDGQNSATILFGLTIIIGGYTLFIKGIKSLVKLSFNMNTIMTIAILGAAAIGQWAEGATVVFLFAISEALESYSMEKARQSIRSLMDVAPKEAIIRRGNEELQVPVDQIAIGDIMIVKPGQKIAMDGSVLSEHAMVNQAAITGESLPVSKTKGDDVFAGTLNEEGLLEIRVTKHAEDTTIARIIHLVEEAQAEKAPSQAFVDRFAKYYTPGIMLAALLTAIIPPLMVGDWGAWIYRALALLVVGCPCALVISTPVSIVTAIGNAARNGVLIKGGIHLEETGRLTAIAFDKTGTLTKGAPVVTDVVRIGSAEEQDILGIAASIEKWSEHPLASAIVKKADDASVDLHAYKADQFQSITGKGAKAIVRGEMYYIGSPLLFSEMMQMDAAVSEQILALQSQGKTVMLLGTEQEMTALLAVADEVRSSSRSLIEKLHSLGIKKTVILTGDNKATANAVAKAVGIDEVKAELMPAQKLEAIKALKQNGNVAMVGDGVNDAPALASATVGIAMGGAGTDTALETADIALMGDDLRKLPFAIQLSRKTMTIIKENISISLLIKVAALLLIIPGWLTLWMAVFADMGATLIVTLNSLRLLQVKE
ncbi:cadmium-translocating P-type ATPase [Cohnella pontilimi]|uniref:Cd(2+)-exporting ATPase n=1 Tax=Cohnella pontilimi TaxID=2564100 RepID=A0A4U0FEY0_9BACL|nr:heavy metal translocating P-type ATPase [Cohnella pontilimi]TJY42904.1 cadmium-translocating P-type ATPase [Cohnella pontilimi]